MYRVLLIALLLLAGCHREKKGKIPDSPVTGSATIVADESLSPLIDTEITVFQGIYLYASVHCQYLPEQEAISRLLQEKVRLGIVTRPLNQNELEHFESRKIIAQSIPLGYDAVAIILHPDNPVNNLTTQQIRDILSGKIMEWNAVHKPGKGTIHLVFDSEASGIIRFLNDTLQLGNKIAGNIAFAGSSGKQAETVASDPDAIGFIGYNQISEKENPRVQDVLRKLKVIAVSAAAAADSTNSFTPSVTSIYNLTYPLTRKIYAVYTDPGTGLPKGFLSHLTSERGQKIIYRMGLKPQSDFQRLVNIKEDL